MVWTPGEIDDDGEEVVVCDECEGTGHSEEPEVEDDGEETGRMADCPVCSGFGRLDW